MPSPAAKKSPQNLAKKAQAGAALGDKRRPLPEEIRALFPDEFTYSDELGWIPKGWADGKMEVSELIWKKPQQETIMKGKAGIPVFKDKRQIWRLAQ